MDLDQDLNTRKNFNAKIIRELGMNKGTLSVNLQTVVPYVIKLT